MVLFCAIAEQRSSATTSYTKYTDQRPRSENSSVYTGFLNFFFFLASEKEMKNEKEEKSLNSIVYSEGITFVLGESERISQIDYYRLLFVYKLKLRFNNFTCSVQ